MGRVTGRGDLRPMRTRGRAGRATLAAAREKRRLGTVAAVCLALVAYGAPPAAAQERSPLRPSIGAEQGAPILLQADTLSYDGETQLWSAIGSVEASQNGRVLTADSLTYDETTGLVVASGNVQLTDPSGPTGYADKITIRGEFRSGIINGLRLVFSENARLAAARAVRTEEGITVLEKAVYSPCEVCQESDNPFWQFKARRVVHDENRRTISYRHARFEVYGVPVAYLPYFSHPDPTVKRKSGFLPPTIGNSTELGEFAEIPYFINLKPNMDLTLSPQITTEEGLMAKAEFRHRTRRGRYQVSGSIANAQVFDETTGALEGRSIRGHIFGNGKFQLTPFNQWGYQLELTTDDTYLRRFNISRKDRLTNNVFFRRFESDGGRTTYDGYYFDGLRATDDDATTPIVPALAEHRTVLQDPILGGEISLDANLLSLFRTDSFDGDLTTNATDTQRGSVSATWERSTVSRLGDVMTVTARGRADIYHTTDNEVVVGTATTLVDGVPTETPIIDDEDFTQSRFLALGAVDWRWPFVSGAGDLRQVIEPIVQLIYSPFGGNPSEIPNEDSISFEFDETNLFGFNKFSGIDVWESGPRANVGVRYAAYGRNFSAGVLVGQSLRLREQEEFPLGSGLEDEISDYVGRVTVEAGDVVELTHRFRIDRTDFEFQRNEIDIDIDTKYVGLRAGYLSIEEQVADTLIGGSEPDTLLEARQEVRLEARANFTDNWGIRGGARRDLENGQMINNFASLIYRDECTEIEGVYRRTFTEDRDVEPETSVLFRLRLRSAGS